MPYYVNRRTPTLDAEFGKLLETVFGSMAGTAFAPTSTSTSERAARAAECDTGSCTPSSKAGKPAALVPALEVTETDDAYLVRAELPGVAPADIEISVEDGRLTLRGEKQRAEESVEGEPRWSERVYASFERTLRLPKTVEPEAVAAASKDGVVTITLPKRKEALPKKIDVRVEG